MSASTTFVDLPDAVVQAVRRASKAFISVQSSRYHSTGSSTCAAGAARQAATTSRVMCTKNPSPEHESGALGAQHVSQSMWSEVYRSAAEDFPDVPAKRLWGLVSTVLSLLEENGSADGVNASAAIVAWNDRFSTQLDDVDALVSSLLRSSPLHMAEDEVEGIGSDVLGRIEDVFLAGRFEAAAALVDALLVFLRRGRSPLLSADVETALADVKRLLATAFHDSDSHEQFWVAGANTCLTEWRNTLVNPQGNSSNTNGKDLSAVDALVCDLCATCKDILLLITQDAELLVERCLESRRSAVDFLVATCAIMTPYAELSHVAFVFAKYVDRWSAEADEVDWYNASVQATLEAATLADMVGAMAAVAKSLAPLRDGSQPTASMRYLDGESDEEEYYNDVDDDAASDTVSLREVTARAVPLTAPRARQFIVACMTAHVADLCAPAGVASSAADIDLTFTRNNLVTAYAELFAFHARTWRVAGLYACYSPLTNPRFLSDIVEGAAAQAAVDEVAFQSLRAFFETTWSSHSALQTAVRAKLALALPGNATVAKWWAAMDFSYTEAYRKVHRFLIATWWNRQKWAMAAWLAIETNLTDTLQSHLRQLLSGPHALASTELYAVGDAVLHGFAGVDRCATPELTRYLCAAATLAGYRQAATAADAALKKNAPAQGSSAATPSLETTVRAVVACLQSIEAALTCTDACAVTLHPSATFALVEHGASLLLTLRQLMRDPTTGDSTGSLHVSSTVLPLLVEAYQLSSIHFAPVNPSLVARSRALAERLSYVHQTCIE